MMNILFITHTAIMGGANRSMVQLAKELKNKYSVNITILAPCSNKKYTIFNVLKEENIPYIATRYYWFKSTPQKRFMYIWFYLLNYIFLFYIILKLRNYKFDIVHSNSSVIDIGAFISKIRKVPHIWHLREFGDLDFNLHSLLGRYYEKSIYKWGGTYFIAISQVIKDVFSYKIDSKKIIVVYNGINELDFNNKKIFKSSNLINICCVGAITEAKNQLDIIKSLYILKEEYKTSSFHLHIIGLETPSYKKILDKYIEKHNLQKYVTFYGERKDVKILLSKMDIGIISSKSEAFGRVTVEYMFSQLAVIASNTGANKEIINDKSTGLLYQLGNEKDLADKIAFLINNFEKRKELSLNGYKIAKKCFSADINTKNIYEMYKKVL